jgi:hypothetical protein
VGSWPEIIADLDSLAETEIEYDGKPIFYTSRGSRRHKSLILLCARWRFRESVVPRFQLI